jgi:formate dehydrogenase accessory protein FdhD
MVCHSRVAPIELTDRARPMTTTVDAIDETGRSVPTPIAGEHPLTLYLDRRELVTLMTLGAAPGCALCTNPSDGSPPTILSFVEDVGRHNAVDAIAGWMWLEVIEDTDTIFYTTGRLTFEMVIKCAQMGIPVLRSRSGLTWMGRELAARIGITPIGRCQGRHYLLFTGRQRFVGAPPPPPPPP